MKKSILITLLLFGSIVTSQAGTARPDIEISHEQVTVTDRAVVVRFDVNVGRRAARRDNTLIYRPGLTDGTSRWALPEIVVQSRRAHIADRRRVWVSGKEMPLDSAFVVDNGSVFSYTAQVPRQFWMSRARVEAEALTVGCCSQSTGEPVLLTMVPDFTPPPTIVTVPITTIIEVPTLTTGERLSREVDWVLPDGEFDRDMPSRMFEQDRDGSLRVLFPLDSWQLDRGYGNNAEVLDMLVETLRELENSTDSRVTGIVVAGYASPEGSFRHNDLLARNRGDALKQYLMHNTDMSGEKIHIYNGVEDWVGLRMLVEASDMPSRAAVLDAIDNHPIWDARTSQGRENIIMKLDGGAPYRYMLQNFFPQLRSASYIKVFYENK